MNNVIVKPTTAFLTKPALQWAGGCSTNPCPHLSLPYLICYYVVNDHGCSNFRSFLKTFGKVNALTIVGVKPIYIWSSNDGKSRTFPKAATFLMDFLVL